MFAFRWKWISVELHVNVTNGVPHDDHHAGAPPDLPMFLMHLQNTADEIEIETHDLTNRNVGDEMNFFFSSLVLLSVMI